MSWLDCSDLAPPPTDTGTLDEQIAQYFRVKQALWAAGFGRYGWPEHVGGLGGPPILRAVVGEEIAARELADPSAWSMIEVLAPTIIDVGRPELVAAMVPPFLRGDELWCQGFSEPDAGSDLASLGCRATAVDGGWSVSGQKVWTSYAQYAPRCVLLARTGSPESRHRGITAFFVDVDAPGITCRPIEALHGRHEFCEVFFDQVFVPADRVLGEIDGGWQVAMDILPYERSTTFWHRGAQLHQVCGRLVAELADPVPSDPVLSDPVPATTARALGEAFQAVFAFRMRSRATQHRLAAGHRLGVETSVDKILMASAEQQLFDTVRELLPGMIEFDDHPLARQWRRDYLYSKAATIYGGTSEVQRNIVAGRLLGLGPEK